MATFELHGEEKEKRDAFWQRHKNCKGNFHNAWGFSTGLPFKYILEPTGIGVCISVQCPYCGEVEDITDVSTW